MQLGETTKIHVTLLLGGFFGNSGCSSGNISDGVMFLLHL
jgi:hypothetical protein